MKDVAIRLQSHPLVELACQHAERLGCSPEKLCLALLTTTLRSGLVDGILDGDSPDEICPRHGVVACNWPLGKRQKRILAHIVSHADANGLFCGSYSAIGAATGIVDVANSLRALIRRGEIERVRMGTNANPTILRIASGGQG
jgi:hypothetical protein